MDKFSNIQVNYAGSGGFNIFLDTVSSFGQLFNKINYLNTGQFHYFFYTDKIEKKQELLHSLEHKTSIELAYGTLKNIIKDRISFYFGIIDTMLEYGFYDLDKDLIYKIGEFSIRNSQIKKLEHSCLKIIKFQLSRINIRNIKFLHSLKIEFREFLKEYDGKIEILDDLRIKKTFSSDIFSEEDLNDNDLTIFINKWAMKKEWYTKVVCYATVVEKEIKFFIRIKAFSTFNIIKNTFN